MRYVCPVEDVEISLFTCDVWLHITHVFYILFAATVIDVGHMALSFSTNTAFMQKAIILYAIKML